MIKIFKKLLIAAVITSGLVGGAYTLGFSAASADACTDLEAQIGRGDPTIVGTLPKYCTTGAIYNKIITGALYAAGIVAVIAIIYGGYLYMTAGAGEEQRKKGRTVLTWAVIGLIVIILATVIVNIVIQAIVENRFV